MNWKCKKTWKQAKRLTHYGAYLVVQLEILEQYFTFKILIIVGQIMKY